MTHHLGDENLQRFLKDFDFLFVIIRESKGELDLRLRDNYFNLYYKGNSLAKIKFIKDCYGISIHEKFVGHDDDEIFKDDDRFFRQGKPMGNYLVYSVTSKLLHPFLQVKYLRRLSSNIKNVNYGEEITFEQMMITDNMERDDWFIIDRQVTEASFQKRMDLLALKQIRENKFQFIVIEVKLGNNSDLEGKVVDQLTHYAEHINDNFDNWKQSYEKYYCQIKQTGIFNSPSFESVEIIKDVKGMVVVAGYSGIARKKIESLKSKYPDIEVKQFSHRL